MCYEMPIWGFDRLQYIPGFVCMLLNTWEFPNLSPLFDLQDLHKLEMKGKA